MKVALTSSNKDVISGKADNCLNYWIYTIENEEVIDRNYIQLENSQKLHTIFVEKMVETFEHPIFEADMLLTNDVSALITARLKEKRTVAFVIEENNLEEVIKQLIKGTLQGHIVEEHNSNCGN